jgi:ubiquinone/menaquinone biosynthesis C-methylase UbiE
MTDLSGRTTYGRVARLYDWCAHVGSLDAIPLVKKLHLYTLKPMSRILYVGGATCEEAIIAASFGHQVTVLDSSAQMLQIASRKATLAGVSSRISFEHQDFFSLSSPDLYDAVALHCFLDIFDPATVRQVLSKSVTLLAP